MKTCKHGVPFYQDCIDCAYAETDAEILDDRERWEKIKALISAALEQGRNDERERCAQVAEDFAKSSVRPGATTENIGPVKETVAAIAKAIRGQS